MKFLHAADIHLDSPLRGLERYPGAPVDQLRGATRRAFVNLIDLALAERVDFVLIVGDLYDGDWKDFNTGLFFCSQISRLSEAGIQAWLIGGNHDAASQITRSLRLPERVHALSARHAETVRIEALGVAIHGQGFIKRAVTENLAEKFPQALPDYFNIGLLHTSANGRPGHEAYAPCNLQDLTSKGYDYWALGHVHAREILCESPWVVFPGNIQGRHIRETGAKGCTLVTVENGQISGVEAHALDVLRWAACDVDVSTATDADGVLDCVQAALLREKDGAESRPLAVRIEIVGPCTAHADLHSHADQWIAEVRSLASRIGDVWVEKIVLRTQFKRDEAFALQSNDAPGILQSIDRWDENTADFDALIATLDDFKRKLPPELRQPD
jgi:DNA repair exonuclease SbcCD nuclease subunit